MRAQDTVAVGWCDPGNVHGAFAASMVRLVRARTDRVGDLIRIQGSGLLSRIRNEMVAAFLDQCTDDWLWMVDTDQKVPVSAFDKLVDAASFTTRPVVAGMVFGAYPTDGLYPMPMPSIRDHDGTGYLPIMDYPPDRVIQVDGVGTGCLLVHRRVLDAIRAPVADTPLRDWCWFADGPNELGAWQSEDLTFCSRIKAAGFPIHAHTGAVLPHFKGYWIGEAHAADWRATHGTG